MSPDAFVVEFRFPEGQTLYAGRHKGALGWAPTLAGALRFESAEIAGRHAANGYGPSAEYAHVMRLDDSGELEEIE